MPPRPRPLRNNVNREGGTDDDSCDRGNAGVRGLDATLQPGGNSTFTPYAGGEISANWLSGDSAPSGALVGFQGILGVQIKPKANGKTSLRLEVRPGYVRTQEHSVTYRVGISQSL